MLPLFEDGEEARDAPFNSSDETLLGGKLSSVVEKNRAELSLGTLCGTVESVPIDVFDFLFKSRIFYLLVYSISRN